MRALSSLALALALVCSCSSAPATQHPAPTLDKPVMTGKLTRSVVEQIPGWTELHAGASAAQIDVDAAKKLATVPPGAEVTLIIGTWCVDSKREVPRLWQALDLAGPVPFAIETMGVDRDKKSPGVEMDVAYVPLVIVRRDGKEVGRIVESAPNGIEKDLLSLLDGTATGIITGRADGARASP